MMRSLKAFINPGSLRDICESIIGTYVPKFLNPNAEKDKYAQVEFSLD